MLHCIRLNKLQWISFQILDAFDVISSCSSFNSSNELAASSSSPPMRYGAEDRVQSSSYSPSRAKHKLLLS